MTHKTVIQRHPIVIYFALVFALAWGGILLIAHASASSDERGSPSQIGLVALPMLFAPGVSALALTALLDGRAGLRTMWMRLTCWQLELRWYLLALAVMPLLVLAILTALRRLVSPVYTPGLELLGLAGLLAGYLEEIGWTGFATPRLLVRWSPLSGGLLLGALWGLWHGLADYVIRGNTLGAFWPVTFSLFVLPLVAWRSLMVWVYEGAPSGVIAQLMHCSYTGSLGLFIPIAALSPEQDALVYAMLAVVLWLAVALLALRQPRLSQALREPVSKK